MSRASAHRRASRPSRRAGGRPRPVGGADRPAPTRRGRELPRRTSTGPGPRSGRSPSGCRRPPHRGPSRPTGRRHPPRRAGRGAERSRREGHGWPTSSRAQAVAVGAGPLRPAHCGRPRSPASRRRALWSAIRPHSSQSGGVAAHGAARGDLVFGHRAGLVADASEEVAGGLVPTELAVQRDGAIDQPGRLERLGGRGPVVQLPQVEDRRVVVQPAPLEGLRGLAVRRRGACRRCTLRGGSRPAGWPSRRPCDTRASAPRSGPAWPARRRRARPATRPRAGRAGCRWRG